jgi:hypothetical protein
MKMTNRSIARARPLLAGGLLLATAACQGGDPAPHGPPVLLQMIWRAGEGHQLVWSAAKDPVLTTQVTPSPLEFDLIFDRRLDGDKIEETFVQDGQTLTRPRPDPPITVDWPQMVAEDSAFSVAISYNSLPLSGLPAGSTYVFGRSTLGYPSGTALTFHLIGDRLTNSKGEAMVGPESITVATAAFAVQIRKPRTAGDATPAPISSDYQVPLTFNNLPAGDDVIHSFVTLTIDAVESDFRLQPDNRDATTLYLTPLPAGQSWPAGGRLAVTVKPGLPDRFGVPLEMAAEATFLVAGGAPDGGGGDTP